MSTVSTAFEKAQAEDRAALVGYLPAGFPDKETAIRAALAMCEAGADVIEVGLPYSDPLMDGPVIADAVYHALKGGTRIADVLDTVSAIADAGTAALVMTYWNPVDKYGAGRVRARPRQRRRGRPDHPGPDARGGRPLARGLRPPPPGPGLPGRAVLHADPHRADHQALPGLRLRRQPDGHHRHQGGRQLGRRRHGGADPRAHRSAGRGRPRRQHPRPGGRGGLLRRRRDRRLRLRPPPRPGARPPTRRSPPSAPSPPT